MEEQIQKQRKRHRDSDTVEVTKKSKHSQGDKLSIKVVDQNFVNSGVTKEHMDMLDSVKGHLKELKQVSDSVQDGDRLYREEPLSKSKARKLKKERKPTECSGDSNDYSSLAGKEIALEYLRLWDQEKDEWSFKKKTQFWLLQNMYQKSALPKSHFKVLLRYLEGLQGHQREVVIKRAQQILDRHSEEQSEDCPTKREYKRAVAILRVLA